jgi:two-component system response regulator GlrR
VSDPTGRRSEDRIVGSSEATRRLIAQATAAARSELPVWVWGPAGCDKEGVARAIHSWGPSGSRPLEILSCGAIPEALQGRELFGCAEGVYPAIPGEYAGALQRAAGTTLLLHDVEQLRPEVLENLLGTLANRSLRREGESQDQPLETRLVLASPAPAEVLGQVAHHSIAITALDQRAEDVLPLAAHYLRAFSEEAGVRPVGFTADARVFLEEESWRGDVAELRARIREAVLLAGDGTVSAEALMLAKEEVPSFKEAKRAFEARYVSGLLRRCGGNISRAARLARKDRKDFYDVIRRTGIEPQDFRK